VLLLLVAVMWLSFAVRSATGARSFGSIIGHGGGDSGDSTSSMSWNGYQSSGGGDHELGARGTRITHLDSARPELGVWRVRLQKRRRTNKLFFLVIVRPDDDRRQADQRSARVRSTRVIVIKCLQRCTNCIEKFVGVPPVCRRKTEIRSFPKRCRSYVIIKCVRDGQVGVDNGNIMIYFT